MAGTKYGKYIIAESLYKGRFAPLVHICGEKHLIKSSAIVYVPCGILHCPINFKRVDKPIMFMHICFASQYSRSKGETSSHPRSYDKYLPDQIRAL